MRSHAFHLLLSLLIIIIIIIIIIQTKLQQYRGEQYREYYTRPMSIAGLWNGLLQLVLISNLEFVIDYLVPNLEVYLLRHLIGLKLCIYVTEVSEVLFVDEEN